MAVFSEEREQSEREERKEMHHTACKGGFNTKENTGNHCRA